MLIPDINSLTLFRTCHLSHLQRKANAYEPAHEIRQLGKGSHFGELSLLNAEPRTATVTVISDKVIALKMSKSKFDEIIASANVFIPGKRGQLVGQDIVDKVPLFKSLSSALKKKIMESMENATFAPETYICRQGAAGSTFYIITSGSCRITINTDDKKEKEVNRIYAGDFFGKNLY
jgi:CRP-like cAMP-binding protein